MFEEEDLSAPLPPEATALAQGEDLLVARIREDHQRAEEGATSGGGGGPATIPVGTEISKTLTQRLLGGHYDCAVCTESIGMKDAIWGCRTCWAIFHFHCIGYWATHNAETEKGSGAASSHQKAKVAKVKTVYCPACRAHNELPDHFKCFCGKVKEPRPSGGLHPVGSCGAECHRKREDKCCSHVCTRICHPGPCPPCSHTRLQSCFCGKDEKTVGCSSNIHGFECGNTCGKPLNCGRHKCEYPCHKGPCQPCTMTKEAECHCGKARQEDRSCGASNSFPCGSKCGKKLSCGNHTCESLCHPGDCTPCVRDTEMVKSCPCGQMPLWQLQEQHPTLTTRTSCTDPIPTCDNMCGMPLPCGEHFCNQPCHDSACPPCLEFVKAPCDCRASTATIRCFTRYLPQSEWQAISLRRGFPKKDMPKSWPWHCDRRCKAMKSCGRHKCENTCCADEDHMCLQVCKKKAPCGIHVCGQLCHKGVCPPCANTSFEPLYCRCRRSVLEPPVPCGTASPSCNHPCVIPRPCGHPANHACHPDTVPCPACAIAVEKRCGSHGTKLDWHHPCHSNPCCNKKCLKALLCCGDTCHKMCHVGPCTHNCKKVLPTLGGPSGSPTDGAAGGGKKKSAGGNFPW